MIETAAYLNGLYPGGLLRDRQAKVNALSAPCRPGRLQSQTQQELHPSLRFRGCCCFLRRSRAALLPSPERDAPQSI